MVNIKTVSAKSIQEAAELIQAGKLVAFPTETVYGLGADATNGQAVAWVFEAKGRPQFNPLIVHVPDIKAAEELVEFNDMARLVAGHLWPGPFTLILPAKAGNNISDLCSAGLPTLAVRIPSHKVARDLLQAAAVPIAAPSANRSGSLSPTAPAHVADSLGDAVHMILAAGPCDVGLESTVLDLSEETPVLLRPGGITKERIEGILGCVVADHFDDDVSPKSPGQLLKHYAPSVPVRLGAIDLEPGEALLAFGSDQFMGIRGGGAAKDLPDHARRNLSAESDLCEAAANLFKMLHDLDRDEHKAIAVMNIPETGLGVAINDRLRRAARG